ncbi:MAG: oligosaccharide flippase family protein [Pseudomonadales bacterium]|nr:oligosaccharide flippase family protein [Candidatus Woesebacteria bacterium]MCB9800827.1 oligosaccharide flippase family protein [Pseudomonadales bacterium]
MFGSFFQKRAHRKLVREQGEAVFEQEVSSETEAGFPQQEQIGEQAEAEALQTIKKRSVTGAISYFIRTGMLQLIGFGANAILSAYLSPSDYGVYGVVVQVVGLLTFFADIGLAAALIQKKGEPTKEDYRTAFTVQQILSWVIVGLTLFVAQTTLFRDKAGSEGIWILIAMGLSFPLATIKTIPSVILERKLDFSKLVLPQVFEQIVFQGSLIYLVLNGYGLISYAYAIILRSVVGAVSMTLLQPWEFGIAIHTNALKGLFGYGAKFQVNDFLARIKDQLFYIFLGLVLPNKEFGYITWAKQWSMYPYTLTVQNVMSVTFPAFSRLQSHTEALKKAIEKSLFFITAAIFPILVGMSVFIEPVIDVFPVYDKWRPALASLILFTLGIGWSAVSTPLANTLNAIGKINITLKLMVMWTSMTWVFTPVLMKYYGYEGVAVAAFIISFTSLLPAYYVKKFVPINFFGSIWRQTVAAVAMALVGWFGRDIWGQSLYHLGCGALLVSIVYCVTFILIGRDTLVREIKSLR